MCNGTLIDIILCGSTLLQSTIFGSVAKSKVKSSVYISMTCRTVHTVCFCAVYNTVVKAGDSIALGAFSAAAA